MKTVDHAWIETFSGKRFHILDPRPEEICIEDIAHALSLQCRFTGHSRFHYSIAQHCYYASYVVPAQFAFEALMHDASEAYISDISRPLKHFTAAGKEYLKVEAEIERALAAKFHLPDKMSPEVKEADNLMLYAEKRQLMTELPWDMAWSPSQQAAKIEIQEWLPIEAETNFMNRYNDLVLHFLRID